MLGRHRRDCCCARQRQQAPAYGQAPRVQCSPSSSFSAVTDDEPAFRVPARWETAPPQVAAAAEPPQVAAAAELSRARRRGRRRNEELGGRFRSSPAAAAAAAEAPKSQRWRLPSVPAGYQSTALFFCFFDCRSCLLLLLLLLFRQNSVCIFDDDDGGDDDDDDDDRGIELASDHAHVQAT